MKKESCIVLDTYCRKGKTVCQHIKVKCKDTLVREYYKGNKSKGRSAQDRTRWWKIVHEVANPLIEDVEDRSATQCQYAVAMASKPLDQNLSSLSKTIAKMLSQSQLFVSVLYAWLV